MTHDDPQRTNPLFDTLNDSVLRDWRGKVGDFCDAQPAADSSEFGSDALALRPADLRIELLVGRPECGTVLEHMTPLICVRGVATCI